MALQPFTFNSGAILSLVDYEAAMKLEIIYIIITTSGFDFVL